VAAVAGLGCWAVEWSSRSPFMNKRWRVPLALACVGVLGWLAWQAWPERGPVYRGKPLSYWLKGFDNGDNGQGKPSFDESVEAVRQTSTNALPVLLRMLRVRDSDLRHRLARLAQKQHLVNINYVTADRQRWAARQGFVALGLYGRSAIPQLLEISMEETSRAEWNKYATEILDLLKEARPNPQGGANGSQPIRPETNSTSSAAGSRR